MLYNIREDGSKSRTNLTEDEVKIFNLKLIEYFYISFKHQH